jgi:hypothetical protein
MLPMSAADLRRGDHPAGHRHLERLPVRRGLHQARNYPMTVQLNNIVNSVQGVKEYNVNMAATC